MITLQSLACNRDDDVLCVVMCTCTYWRYMLVVGKVCQGRGVVVQQGPKCLCQKLISAQKAQTLTKWTTLHQACHAAAA